MAQGGNLAVPRGAARPAGVRTFFSRNKYDDRRGQLAVLNWDRKQTVDVSFDGFLKPGQRFRLMDPKDFYGKPVYSGAAWVDGRVSIPVKNEFGAFIVFRE